MRCPVELTGRYSVMPSTNPNTTACHHVSTHALRSGDHSVRASREPSSLRAARLCAKRFQVGCERVARCQKARTKRVVELLACREPGEPMRILPDRLCGLLEPLLGRGGRAASDGALNAYGVPSHTIAQRADYQTIARRAWSGRTRTTLRAGFALMVIASFVKGLIPGRAFVAGLRLIVMRNKPGTVKMPEPLFDRSALINELMT